MAIKIKPASQIKASLGLEHNGRVQRFFQSTCYKAMTNWVPKSGGTDGGSLRENVDMSNPYYIIYEMPYASYQYYGRRFNPRDKRRVRKYTTPGTGPYWDKRMWSARKDEILEAVKTEIERGGKR